MSKGLKKHAPSTPLLENLLNAFDNEVLRDMYNMVDNRSPQTKHFIHSVRSVIGESRERVPLNLNFDEEKAFNASFKELETVLSNEENAFILEAEQKLLKILRKSKAKAQEEIEHVVCNSVKDLIELFWANLETPDKFHEQKVPWLETFNERVTQIEPVQKVATA